MSPQVPTRKPSLRRAACFRWPTSTATSSARAGRTCWKSCCSCSGASCCQKAWWRPKTTSMLPEGEKPVHLSRSKPSGRFTCDWKTVFGISYESFCWFVIIGKICPQLCSLRCSFLRATYFQWHPGSYGSFWFLKKVFTVEPFCQLNPRVFIFLELCSLSPHKWVLPYSIPAPVRDA